MTDATCPICEGMWGGTCKQRQSNFDGHAFDCEICGTFRASGRVMDDGLLRASRKMNEKARASLCHFVRSSQFTNADGPMIMSDWLESFLKNVKLPTPAQQATNIIRYIGDQVADSGKPWKTLPKSFFAAVGSPNPDFAFAIVKELLEGGLVSGSRNEAMGRIGNILNASLTLAGWERYEAEKLGKLAGNYGFIAMKFGDSSLDPFVGDVVKPAVIGLGYSLIDLRDAAQPGIIDNILREKIRDAAFILVDLTHDNSGAYWEVGYAEGLGKPVLYLCEQVKFDEKKTHFDTNHCTTVIWGGPKSNDDFSKELRATLRNSLKLFPNS